MKCTHQSWFNNPCIWANNISKSFQKSTSNGFRHGFRCLSVKKFSKSFLARSFLFASLQMAPMCSTAAAVQKLNPKNPGNVFIFVYSKIFALGRRS